MKLSNLTPLRVIPDDTGDEFDGWPSVVAKEEADLTLIHRAGFKQKFWGDLSMRDAVSLANELVALAKRPAPVWIPVSDRLPDYDAGERVLVLTKWGEMAVALLDWEQGHNPDFWHVVHDYRFEMEDVTHWMPLPPIPPIQLPQS